MLVPRMSASRSPVSMANSSANSARAAASLNRLSPSTSTDSRRGAPISRKMPTTATGSVVATMEPSSRQAISPTPLTGASMNPTNSVVTITATTASSRMGARSSISRRTSITSAASNSKVGRKMKMNRPGDSLMPLRAAMKSPAIPVGSTLLTPATTTPSAQPVAASNTENGSLSRRARAGRKLTMARRPETPRTVRAISCIGATSWRPVPGCRRRRPLPSLSARSS